MNKNILIECIRGLQHKTGGWCYLSSLGYTKSVGNQWNGHGVVCLESVESKSIPELREIYDNFKLYDYTPSRLMSVEEHMESMATDLQEMLIDSMLCKVTK